MQPPDGSRLSVEWISGQQTIVAPPPSRGATAIFVAIFLLFWLGAWTFGGLDTMRTLAAGQAGNAELFLGFWLVGWALGVGFAVFALYRIVRPTIPERFMLRDDGLDYDSGVAPPRMYVGHHRAQLWRDFLPKRIMRVFSGADLKTLRLREGEDANRLTVDVGADRYDLAKTCTDVEREWLFQTLSEHYRLADDWRNS